MFKLLLIANHTKKTLFNTKFGFWWLVIFNLLLLIALFVNLQKVNNTDILINKYQKINREHWEQNPNKHPHRMAHFGYLVFRQVAPLSFFDQGLNNYVGNTIFLEAHKQNTTNNAEISQASSLLRFGDFSPAFVLQLLLPLVLIFNGYYLVAKEHNNGNLKLLLVQGAKLKNIFWGKTLGLFLFALWLIIPVFVISFVILNIFNNSNVLILNYQLLIVFFCYLFYAIIFCVLIISVSMFAKNTNKSLGY